MAPYLEEVRKLDKRFLSLELQHIRAALTRKATTSPSERFDVSPRAQASLKKDSQAISHTPRCRHSATSRRASRCAIHGCAGLWPDLGSPLVAGAGASGRLQGCGVQGLPAPRHVARQATSYCLRDGELYRRRPNGVSLQCISEEQGCELLADIHGVDCGHHSSPHTLAGKVFLSGFYWPTLLRDTPELVRSDEACQIHAKQIHQPAQWL